MRESLKTAPSRSPFICTRTSHFVNAPNDDQKWQRNVAEELTGDDASIPDVHVSGKFETSREQNQYSRDEGAIRISQRVIESVRRLRFELSVGPVPRRSSC